MDCRSAPGSGKPRRQRAHARRGERLHAETGDGGRGGYVSPHQAERVAGAHLVVEVRGDQQRAPVHDAAGREPHQVQRRLVRPVQVFEDEHQRPAAAAIASSTSRKRVSLPSEMRTVAPGRRGTTSSGGPRRAGRGEGIAAPGEHGGAVAGHLAEAAHERRLADPRLAPPRPRPTRAGGRPRAAAGSAPPAGCRVPAAPSAGADRSAGAGPGPVSVRVRGTVRRVAAWESGARSGVRSAWAGSSEGPRAGWLLDTQDQAPKPGAQACGERGEGRGRQWGEVRQSGSGARPVQLGGLARPTAAVLPTGPGLEIRSCAPPTPPRGVR